MPAVPTSHSQARRLSIAIDGPAGAGKSTVARRVAQALDYTYIDTGAMYRAVAWTVLKQGIDPEDRSVVTDLAKTLEIQLYPGETTRVFVGDTEITDMIRMPQISNLTSQISALPALRTHIVALQQAMSRTGGIVMEGRDIGTVVLPKAEVKVFLTASLKRRAERRQAELAAHGTPVLLDTLLTDIAERDVRDGSRDVSPMVPARDAIILDSDTLSIDEVVSRILELHRKAAAHYG